MVSVRLLRTTVRDGAVSGFSQPARVLYLLRFGFKTTFLTFVNHMDVSAHLVGLVVCSVLRLVVPTGSNEELLLI